MFTGFPPEIFAFYRELASNNTRDWWGENRWTYDEVVVPTVMELLDELPDRYLPMHIFRPYRNVRFSKDKTPYKTHIGISGASLDGDLHYVELNPDGMRVTGGYYAMSWDQLRRYREAVDDDTTGSELRRIVDAAQARGYWVGGFPAVQYAPKGYDRDHPRVSLLRLSGLTTTREYDLPNAWLHTRRALGEIIRTWEAGADVAGWLNKHVGPPDLG